MRRVVACGLPLVLAACRGVLGISTLTYDGGVDAHESRDVTTEMDTGVDAGFDAGEDSTTPPRDAAHDVERDSGHDSGEHDSGHDSGHDAGMSHPDAMMAPPDGGCVTNCVNTNGSEVPSFLMSYANLDCRCNSCATCSSATCQPTVMGPTCPTCVADLILHDGGVCSPGPLSCASGSCQTLLQCIHGCP